MSVYREWRTCAAMGCQAETPSLEHPLCYAHSPDHCEHRQLKDKCLRCDLAAANRRIAELEAENAERLRLHYNACRETTFARGHARRWRALARELRLRWLDVCHALESSVAECNDLRRYMEDWRRRADDYKQQVEELRNGLGEAEALLKEAADWINGAADCVPDLDEDDAAQMHEFVSRIDAYFAEKEGDNRMQASDGDAITLQLTREEAEIALLTLRAVHGDWEPHVEVIREARGRDQEWALLPHVTEQLKELERRCTAAERVAARITEMLHASAPYRANPAAEREGRKNG